MQKNQANRRKPKRIWVTDLITNTLKKEFNCTGPTVLSALKFHTYSDQAIQIRKRAMEMMEETNKNNKELLQENQD